MNYIYIWNVKIKRGYPFWTASNYNLNILYEKKLFILKTIDNY